MRSATARRPGRHSPRLRRVKRLQVGYAILSRVFDPRLERTVIAVAGLADRDTGAAGEFLTNESYMQAAFANAPDGWYKKNIQVVIKMALVGGTAGPPRVIKSYFW